MKKQTVFIIPFVLPWSWSAGYQRQTCLELAKKYLVVAYMNRDAIFLLKALFQRIKYPKLNNIKFYRPLYLIPFRRFSGIEKMNKILSYKLFERFYIPGNQNILWIFDPAFYMLPQITRGLSVYDCVDFHAGFQRGVKKAEIKKQENILIRSVNYFLVNSHTLFRIHKAIRHATVVPAGFRYNDFHHIRRTKIHFPQDKPVIGYIGAIDERTDFSLFRGIIQRHPEWTFVLWGSIQVEQQIERRKIQHCLQSITTFPNVINGFSTPDDVPFVIKQISIGIIPYDVRHGGVVYSYPMKLFEYFYMGKPVVSTPIEELKRFPKYVKIGNTVESWEKHITSLLRHPWSNAMQKKQRVIARANSWPKKVLAIERFINESRVYQVRS